MNLGNQPQRNVVGPFLLRSHAKKAAGVFEVVAEDPIVAVEKQAGLIDRRADDNHGRLAIVHVKVGRVDPFPGGGLLEDRFELERKLAADPSDSQAVDFPGPPAAAGGMICSSATRQTTSLIVGSPKGRGTIATFSRQRLGFNELAAVAADASDHGSGPPPFLSSAQPPTINSPATAVAVNIVSHTGTRFFEFMERNPFRDSSKDMSFDRRESSVKVKPRSDQTPRRPLRRTVNSAVIYEPAISRTGRSVR